jgi:hypothetical protein
MIDVIMIFFILGVMFLCLNVIITNLITHSIDRNLVNSKAMRRYKIFNKITFIGLIVNFILFITYLIHYGLTG